ncbi:MAG: NAD(P)H-dependent oxidoreductase [Alphaproteobacteria bacterium]
MTTILHIDSGIFGAKSASNGLSAAFVAALRAARPEIEVVRRDLAADPLPHLDATLAASFMTAPADRDGAVAEAGVRSDVAVAELQAADILVIGLPMYNFNVPSTFKAWFDHVARAGVTFRYTAQGPEGLLSGKKAYILTARGGRYNGTGADHQEPFIRQFLGFLGIADVTFVYAEGLRLGEDVAAAALQAAHSEIASLAAAA